MTTIWFVDTETGGLDSQVHSILSLGLVEWVDGRINFEDEWRIKEDPMVVTPEALAVNQIDLRNPADWQSPSSVVTDLMDVIPGRTTHNAPMPILGGHNTPFDVGFVRRLFQLAGLAGAPYPFSHRYIDTLPVARFLRDAGVIKVKGGGLTALCEYFGIKNKERHGALGDARATAELYTCLIDAVKSPRTRNK